MGFLARGELGLSAAQATLGSGDGEAFAGPELDQVGFELGHHREHVEQQPTDGVGRVVHRGTDGELHLARGEFGDDVAGVRHGAGEPVELGDHQRVAAAASGHGLAQTRSRAGGAGEPMVDVDPLGLDSEPGQGVALGGEVSGVGGDPSVANQQSAHPGIVPWQSHLR